MNEQYTRHKNIFDPTEMNRKVTVIGCGSLGSYIAKGLAKLGFSEFYLWDDDTVELHNLPNQLYDYGDLGQEKVVALRNFLELEFDECSGVDYLQGHPNLPAHVVLKTFNSRWTGGLSNIDEGIIISAADSIQVRKEVFENAPKNSFIVDVRSSGESFNVFFCDTNDEKQKAFYSKFFFDPSNSAGANCNAQSIVYSSMLIASLALSGIVRFSRLEEYPASIDGDLSSFDVCPFYTTPRPEVAFV